MRRVIWNYFFCSFKSVSTLGEDPELWVPDIHVPSWTEFTKGKMGTIGSIYIQVRKYKIKTAMIVVFVEIYRCFMIILDKNL